VWFNNNAKQLSVAFTYLLSNYSCQYLAPIMIEGLREDLRTVEIGHSFSWHAMLLSFLLQSVFGVTMYLIFLGDTQENIIFNNLSAYPFLNSLVIL